MLEVQIAGHVLKGEQNCGFKPLFQICDKNSRLRASFPWQYFSLVAFWESVATVAKIFILIKTTCPYVFAIWFTNPYSHVFLFKTLNKFMVMLFFYFGLWYPPKGREIGHWIHYCPHTYANAPLNCLKLLIIECKQCDKQDFLWNWSFAIRLISA